MTHPFTFTRQNHAPTQRIFVMFGRIVAWLWPSVCLLSACLVLFPRFLGLTNKNTPISPGRRTWNATGGFTASHSRSKVCLLVCPAVLCLFCLFSARKKVIECCLGSFAQPSALARSQGCYMSSSMSSPLVPALLLLGCLSCLVSFFFARKKVIECHLATRVMRCACRSCAWCPAGLY